MVDEPSIYGIVAEPSPSYVRIGRRLTYSSYSGVRMRRRRTSQ